MHALYTDLAEIFKLSIPICVPGRSINHHHKDFVLLQASRSQFQKTWTAVSFIPSILESLPCLNRPSNMRPFLTKTETSTKETNPQSKTSLRSHPNEIPTTIPSRPTSGCQPALPRHPRDSESTPFPTDPPKIRRNLPQPPTTMPKKNYKATEQQKTSESGN